MKHIHKALHHLPIILQRTAQAARMMVGVGDYPGYKLHMEQHHPEITPMSEQEYFRYCQDARYPSKSGKISRCPC
ncbi:MAG: YbdD/YjiX family protein [Moraxellaceae bacterium]|nr:MAG: YbdD/YjiX family protein [Moraxellaceae bacterium]